MGILPFDTPGGSGQVGTYMEFSRHSQWIYGTTQSPGTSGLKRSSNKPNKKLSEKLRVSPKT